MLLPSIGRKNGFALIQKEHSAFNPERLPTLDFWPVA